ncbi:MAG: hypothetical protein H7Y38_17275 [Armatimonadetes bacterium]|nr:hypothetical protein [Armatimonadota bacterium]
MIKAPPISARNLDTNAVLSATFTPGSDALGTLTATLTEGDNVSEPFPLAVDFGFTLPLPVKDLGFALRFEREPFPRWLLTATVENEAKPSRWFSVDARTWSRDI